MFEIFDKFSYFLQDQCDLTPACPRKYCIVNFNKTDYPLGCSGAVDTKGHPSKKYCENTGSSANEEFKWWKDCCKWDVTRKKCIDKRCESHM